MANPTWYEEERAFLKQFARAITCDHFLGGEIVAAALRSFDPGACGDLDVRERRICVFRAFFDVWNNARNGASPAPFTSEALLHSSPFVDDAARQLALLVDVLGIAAPLAGTLLKLEPGKAARLIEEERRRIDAERVSLRALIIEDEPLIAMDLSDTLEQYGVNVVGAARNAEKALELARAREPEILIADFDLGAAVDGVGAVRAIAQERAITAIFVTAFPQKVLSADEYEPVFVLSKPFDDRALRTAVVQSASMPRARLVA